jgi:hypothetical protein
MVFCIMRICIGCNMLEKYEDVVGRTRGQRRARGAVGRRNRLSLRHVSFRPLHCISKLHDGGSDAGCVR